MLPEFLAVLPPSLEPRGGDRAALLDAVAAQVAAPTCPAHFEPVYDGPVTRRAALPRARRRRASSAA